jgi:hypothetical protein
MVAACALLWFLVSLRGLRSAIAAAVASGLAICGVHYLGQYAIGVHLGVLPGVLPTPVTGVAPMTVMLPTMIFGSVLVAMLWFFTVGTATRRDLRAVFKPSEDSGQIEPWIIDTVVRRVATIAPGPAGTTVPQLTPPNRRTRIPSLAPVFRSVQVARTLDAHAVPEASTPISAMSPVPVVFDWSDRVPTAADPPPWTEPINEPFSGPLSKQNSPLPERAKDRNTREHIDARAEDLNATLRRVSTVHRDKPPTAAAAPVSPAPGLLPRRPRPGVGALADVVPDADGRPRNRRLTP